MNVVYVVTENAGYDVGLIMHAAFSTRQKADDWIAAKRAEYADRAGKDGVSWGGPRYDVEELQVDADVGGGAQEAAGET